MNIEDRFVLKKSETCDKYILNISRSDMGLFLERNLKIVNCTDVRNFIVEDENSSETFMLRKEDGYRKETKRYYKFIRMAHINLDNHLSLFFILSPHFKLQFGCPFLSPLVWKEQCIDDCLSHFHYSIINSDKKTIAVSIVDENDDEYTKKDIFTYLSECTDFIRLHDNTDKILNYFGYNKKYLYDDNDEPPFEFSFRGLFGKRYRNIYSLQWENYFEHTFEKLKKHPLFGWLDF